MVVGGDRSARRRRRAAVVGHLGGGVFPSPLLVKVVQGLT